MLSNPLHRGRQLGMSLVELLIGIAVGLFVVAAAATVMTTQLTENRRLMLEVQVQQDIRASADIITRELRRAGSIAFLGDATGYVWTPGSSWSPNGYLTVTPAAGSASSVTFQSSRTQGQSGPYGFRLQNGVIQSQLAAAGWQALTDRNTMIVTTFNVTALNEPAVVVPCPKLCADGSQDCWPQVRVRSFVIDITGRSASDASVVRSVRSTVRLKSDEVITDNSLGARTCPA